MAARAFLRYTLMILSILFLLLAAGCTFYSEEIIEPVVPDEGEPDSPDEPDVPDVPDEPDSPDDPDVPPVPSEYPSARYYYDLLIEKYGDMSEGYKAGDRIKANIYNYHYGDITVSGSFSAVVLDPSDIEVEQAILLLGEKPVIVDNSIVQSGESTIEEIQSIVKDYMDNLVDTGFSEYSSDYFLIAREAGGDSIQANDSSGTQKSYAVRSFKAIREKQESDSYTSALAVQFILGGDEPIWIEAETDTGSIIENWKCRFYSIGSYHEGEPGRLSIPAGAEYIPSAAFISDIIVERYGDGSDGYKDGDRIKAVINTPFFHQGTGKSIKGGFEVEISGDSVYVEAASLLIDDERITAIGGEIVDGSFDISTIQNILLSYCEKFHESQFKSSTSDYFLFEREMSEPLLLNAVFDEEWVMRWCSLDLYRIVREKQEGNAFDSDIAIRISLSDGSGYSAEMELSGSASKLGKDVVYYKLGSQEEGSPSGSIIKGPENQPDGMYYYNLLVSKFGDGSDGYREGDRFWGILYGFASQKAGGAYYNGQFEATVIQSEASGFGIYINNAELEANGERLEAAGLTLDSSDTSLPVGILDFMDIVGDGMKANGDGVFYFCRRASGGTVYAYDSSWNLQEYHVREYQVERTGDEMLVECILDGSNQIEIEVVKKDAYSPLEIQFFKDGNVSYGNQGGFEISGPDSWAIDGEYYLERLSSEYDVSSESMSVYKSGDSVETEFDDYFYNDINATEESVSGKIASTVQADGSFDIVSADFTFITNLRTWTVVIRNGAVEQPVNTNVADDYFLSAARRFLNDSLNHLDSEGIVGFSHTRNLAEDNIAFSCMDMNHIPRDYHFSVFKLTKDRNRDVRLDCQMNCEENSIRLVVINDIVTDYQQN